MQPVRPIQGHAVTPAQDTLIQVEMKPFRIRERAVEVEHTGSGFVQKLFQSLIHTRISYRLSLSINSSKMTESSAKTTMITSSMPQQCRILPASFT